jgi:uncharacterized membrane protein
MLKLAATYVPTLLILLVIDAAWLGLVALPMFRAALGADLLTFRPVPGVLFYLIYAAGIMVFVLPAAGGAWQMTLLYGALFGLFTYGTYDLTNYATLKPWTLTLASADIVWGMVVTAATGTLGMLAGDAILKRLS